MTQEDKELLLKDLCARLNTNLVCSIYRIEKAKRAIEMDKGAIKETIINVE